ncbi:MAG: hypothetical protein MAG794_01172 [Gammaproteobacteria bacterium]|nr:hypothetical protein [Gammaproteobacteria bacterium]
MRIPAHDRHPRQRKPLLGPDNMDDALADIVQVELRDAVPGAVLVEGVDLQSGYRVRNAPGTARRWYIVIRHGDIGVHTPRSPAGHIQSIERLGRSHLVNEMPVNVDQAVPIVTPVYNVGIPEFVIKRFSSHS